MDANLNSEAILSAKGNSLIDDFPLKPFGIRHNLASHPLLTLHSIAKLAWQMPRDLIEYNSGDAAIDQDPGKVNLVDLDPVEVVKSIETAGAWMVIKRVEKVPAYHDLLESALLSLAKAKGFDNLSDAGFSNIEGFVFVSSSNSTTPFHMDAEDNFHVLVRGDKTILVYDNRDGLIASEEQVEWSTVKHRNVKFKNEFNSHAVEFHMRGGEGCYIPYQWPHWVKTGNTWSISLAITWKTKQVKHLNDLRTINSLLRSFGISSAAPNINPIADNTKLAAYRTLRAMLEPLRASETMRRAFRRIALGKNANYFLKRL